MAIILIQTDMTYCLLNTDITKLKASLEAHVTELISTFKVIRLSVQSQQIIFLNMFFFNKLKKKLE